MATNLSELEEAIETVVKTYNKYASKGLFRRKRAISKDSFQKMLSQELHHMLTGTENRQAVDAMRKSCDQNHDGQISFEDYWTLIGRIAHSVLFTMEEPEENTEN